MTESRNPFTLPALPDVSYRLVEDLSPPGPSGFLKLLRRRWMAEGPGLPATEPFVYDEVDRRCLDAVVIAPHFRGKQGELRTFLRSAPRPPVVMRDAKRGAVAELEGRLGLWELPAGLVEAEECSPEGLVQCARRELSEELGLTAELAEFMPLGPSTFPCPGVIAERHFFFHVRVEPALQTTPSLDGSAVELLGVTTELSVEQALSLCRRGEIEDAKTELALRRLAELDGELS